MYFHFNYCLDWGYYFFFVNLTFELQFTQFYSSHTQTQRNSKYDVISNTIQIHILDKSEMFSARCQLRRPINIKTPNRKASDFQSLIHDKLCDCHHWSTLFYSISLLIKTDANCPRYIQSAGFYQHNDVVVANQMWTHTYKTRRFVTGVRLQKNSSFAG